MDYRGKRLREWLGVAYQGVLIGYVLGIGAPIHCSSSALHSPTKASATVFTQQGSCLE